MLFFVCISGSWLRSGLKHLPLEQRWTECPNVGGQIEDGVPFKLKNSKNTPGEDYLKKPTKETNIWSAAKHCLKVPRQHVTTFIGTIRLMREPSVHQKQQLEILVSMTTKLLHGYELSYIIDLNRILLLGTCTILNKNLAITFIGLSLWCSSKALLGLLRSPFVGGTDCFSRCPTWEPLRGLQKVPVLQ